MKRTCPKCGFKRHITADGLRCIPCGKVEKLREDVKPDYSRSEKMSLYLRRKSGMKRFMGVHTITAKKKWTPVI